MDARRITLLKDLDVLKDDHTLKVYIIRLWTKPMFKDSKKKYSYEMIIMDKQVSLRVQNSKPVLQRGIVPGMKTCYKKSNVYSSIG
ncbi:hypothetical protein R6Q57_006019 [Mikania cordata]